MIQAARQRTQVANLLRRAMERNELRLVYQPIVDADVGETVALEALLRWNSTELGPIGPDMFIPLAEETGLIQPIGAWVLRTACADAAEWNRDKAKPIGVAVNVSPRQLFAEGFIDLVAEILRDTGLPTALLKIEITESSLVQDVEACKRVLEALAGLGVTLALDDFGTGYSALSYLQQFKFHVLKLDQSFVRKMVPGESSAALTASIIAMAKSLGMKTVAEGVEHPAHWVELRAQGCEYVQGYHFSRPLPKQDLVCLRTGQRAET
jgi:EAL domain-containing protein (putative c-di-GMP-specific phosphodiesterase class I)